MPYPAAEKTVALLEKHQYSFSTAESCTGGGIAQQITSVPGSSAVFMGGIVAYANRIKQNVLGVSEQTLLRHGAVSAECAAEMAAGACKVLKTDAAVSVTGIAGPGGGTPEKPVGLVYIGAAIHGTVRTARFLFSGNREEIRSATAEAALNMICEMIRSENKS